MHKIRGEDGKEYISIELTNYFETEQGYVDRGAILINQEEEVWLPKSQLEIWPDVGEEGEVLAVEWILKERGLV